jgi:hypothetical protein
MGDRKYRFTSIIAAAHLLFEQIAASCREGLSLSAKIEGVLRRKKTRRPESLPTAALRLRPQHGAQVAPLRCPILRLG